MPKNWFILSSLSFLHRALENKSITAWICFVFTEKWMIRWDNLSCFFFAQLSLYLLQPHRSQKSWRSLSVTCRNPPAHDVASQSQTTCHHLSPYRAPAHRRKAAEAAGGAGAGAMWLDHTKILLHLLVRAITFLTLTPENIIRHWNHDKLSVTCISIMAVSNAPTPRLQKLSLF